MSHREWWTFKPERDLGSFGRILLFLSKTDRTAVRFCTYETLLTQMSFGFIVLLTSLFAWLSGFFAIQATFADPTQPMLVLVGAGAVATLYATTIGALDRELVGAGKEEGFRAVIGTTLRLVLAVVVALVISFPLELRMMDGRIKDEVGRLVRDRNIGKVAEIASIDSARSRAFATWRERVVAQERIVAAEAQRASAEAQNVRPGVRYEGIMTNLTLQREILAQIRADAPQPDSLVAQRQLELRRELASAQLEATDFLSRAEALARIQAQSPEAVAVTWGLRALFLVLELMPALLKLLAPYGEYHAYLRARRHINVQKIHCLTGDALQEIAKAPREALGRDEFTDELAGALEDPIAPASPSSG